MPVQFKIFRLIEDETIQRQFVLQYIKIHGLEAFIHELFLISFFFNIRRRIKRSTMKAIGSRMKEETFL